MILKVFFQPKQFHYFILISNILHHTCEGEPALPSVSKSDNSCSENKKHHLMIAVVVQTGPLLFLFPKKYSRNDSWLHQLDGNALLGLSQLMDVWVFKQFFSLEVFSLEVSFHPTNRQKIKHSSVPAHRPPRYLPFFSKAQQLKCKKEFLNFHILCIWVNLLLRCLQIMGGSEGWRFFIGNVWNQRQTGALILSRGKKEFSVSGIFDGQGASATNSATSLHTGGSFIPGYSQYSLKMATLTDLLLWEACAQQIFFFLYYSSLLKAEHYLKSAHKTLINNELGSREGHGL